MVRVIIHNKTSSGSIKSCQRENNVYIFTTVTLVRTLYAEHNKGQYYKIFHTVYRHSILIVSLNVLLKNK